MSDDIRQRWADTATNVSNDFRKVDLSDASPALGGDVIMAGISVDSAGAEILMATSTLQTTGNGILTTIDADTGAIATSAASIDTKTPALGQALAAASVPVVLTAAQVTTLTPPAAITGFATAANQSTLIGHIDGIETLLTSIAAAQLPDSHNVTVDNASIAVTGTFWQATQPVSAASLPLPSGASTAAKQPALGTAGTASADVITVQGVASMTPLSVSGTVTAELSATDNAVLDAIAASLAGTLTVASHAVTNAGTFAVQAAQAGTWTVQPGNTANTTAWLVTGTGGTFPVTGTFWQATQPVSLASVPSHAVTNAGTFAVQATALTPGTAAANLGKAEDAVHASGDTGVMALAVRKATPANVSGTDGDYEPLQVSAGRLWTSATIDAALPSGTNAIGRLAANAGVTIGAVEIAATQTLSTVTTVTTLTGGGIAHDAADSGNPHKIGAKATTALSGLTLVANADRTDLFAGVDGVQIVRPYTGLEDIVSGVAAITDGSSTSVIAAAGSGIKVYITSVIISNSSATAVTVDIRDGSAGTVKATFPVPANTAGVVLSLPVPLPFSANTAVCADPSAAASTVTVTLVGFKSKV